MFPSPDEFRPERFLETSNPRLKSFELPFGFGRRICPGMHLALNSLFINVSRILWAFSILPAINRDGSEVIPGISQLWRQRVIQTDSTTLSSEDPWNFTDGFNSKPVSFNCRFVSRSAQSSVCIEDEFRRVMRKLNGWIVASLILKFFFLSLSSQMTYMPQSHWE